MNTFEVDSLDVIADICKCVASSEEVAFICVFMNPDPVRVREKSWVIRVSV